jgi:hypothetical protein
MAPASRMTRSIKEKQTFFLLFVRAYVWSSFFSPRFSFLTTTVSDCNSGTGRTSLSQRRRTMQVWATEPCLCLYSTRKILGIRRQIPDTNARPLMSLVTQPHTSSPTPPQTQATTPKPLARSLQEVYKTLGDLTMLYFLHLIKPKLY